MDNKADTPGSAALLGLILVIAAGLRFTGIGWGIQRYDASLAAGTENRTTFNSDEHVIIDLVAAMRPREGDFRPRFWAWGTFHCYVVAAALGAAQVVGVFPGGDWRSGFKAGDNTTVRRVYVVGRAVSAALGVASVLLVYPISRDMINGVAGLWAAAALALSPIHVLNCHFVTPDVGLSFWLLLAILAAEPSRFALGGFLVGVATSVKVSGVFFAPLPLLFAMRSRARPWWAALGFALGYLVAEPYAVIASEEWWGWLAGVAGYIPAFAPVQLELGRLQFYLIQLLLYGLGPAGFMLAAGGLRSLDSRVLSAIAASVFVLSASWITMARYMIPLLVFVSIAAGASLVRLGGRRAAVAGALFLVPAGVVSGLQVRLMRMPHTGQLAADWITLNVPAGTEIARTWDRYPLLDGHRWRLTRLVDPYRSSPFVAPNADVIVLDNLSLLPLRSDLQAVLRERYVEAAHFVRRPELFGLTLPEPYAAQDWKYTHPEIRVLRRLVPGVGIRPTRSFRSPGF